MPAGRRLLQEPGGPLLVEGPVEVVLEDGRTARSDRPVVALCTCRRSRLFPWCDTSHRGRKKPPVARQQSPDARDTRESRDAQDAQDAQDPQ